MTAKDLFFTDQSDIIINYLLKKVLFSQPESFPEDGNPNIQITKEFLEQWVAQGFDLDKIGAGNYPIDVYSKEKKFGIDVKFISLTRNKNGNFGSITNESSLAQNFETGGRNLDNLFHNNQYSEILEMWINILSIKMNKVKINLLFYIH